MSKKLLAIIIAACSCSAAIGDLTTPLHPNKFKYHFYAGVTGGHGWSTWSALVPPLSEQNEAMVISTPVHVDESGPMWGGFLGYELLPFFALEFAYMHYPNATVEFDEDSIFAFDNDETEFLTKTDVISLMGKVMFFLPNTDTRIFSSFGIAQMHRRDFINDRNINTPCFGLGINYNFSANVMGEIGVQYVAGYGVSELSPVEDYFPFLYSAFFRIGWRF